MSEHEQFAASQPEKPLDVEELERAHAAQKAYALDQMASDYECRAKLLKEAANALRAKAGLPERI